PVPVTCPRSLHDALPIWKEAGLSQAELAKAIGTGQSTIASIENGRNQGSGFLVDIARVLGVRPDWLASGRAPMRDDDGSRVIVRSEEHTSELQSRENLVC